MYILYVGTKRIPTMTCHQILIMYVKIDALPLYVCNLGIYTKLSCVAHNFELCLVS